MRGRGAVLLAAVMLCAAAAAPAPGLVRYAAFGDSITLGGPPFEPTVKGYPRRLQTRLRNNGIDARVVNYGVGGERTAQGVTRIDSVLDDEAWDVLLLMEGTNDVFKKISTETILFNLGVMVDKATARGIDTVLATIIRRRYNPGHARTNALAAGIRDLAAGRQVTLADPWQVLCPDTPCFDAYYYQGSDDPVGHPNPDGFWVLTGAFSDVIIQPTPGAAVPGAPAGDIGPATPTYDWSRVAEATWYRLTVDGPGGRVVDRWYKASDVCSGQTCAATPGEALAAGAHSWRVRTRNPAGPGAWSAYADFMVYTDPPAAASALSPAGDLYGTEPLTPTYEWSAVTDATDYMLRVDDDLGELVLLELHPAAASCGPASCAATPEQALEEDDYVWRVRAQNPAGAAPWSAPTGFSVHLSPPGAPSPVYPEGEIFDTAPAYRWPPVPGAVSYRLEVQRPSDPPLSETFDAAAICTPTLCAATPATPLVPGIHAWTVVASSSLGEGPAGGPLDFEVLPCEEPVDREVEAGEITDARVERACGLLTAADGVTVGPGGDLTLHAGDAVILDEGFRVGEGGRLAARVDL